MGIIIGIILFLGIILISNKIANLKSRAIQHALKGTGFSSVEQFGVAGKIIEKPYIEKIIKENPEYTEELIKEKFINFATQLFNKNPINQFSEKVCEKMQHDSKLEKIADMQFQRIQIVGYSNKYIIANGVYNDNKDEYRMVFDARIENGDINLIRYSIDKSFEIGF